MPVAQCLAHDLSAISIRLVVVYDDRSLALIDLKQRALGYGETGVHLGATDHVAIARAFGGRGFARGAYEPVL